MARSLVVVVSMLACGGGKPAAISPPPPPPADVAVAPDAAVAPAPVAATPPPFSKGALPEWPLTIPPEAATESDAGPYAVYAADVSGDHLLMDLATFTPFIAVATGKRLTGRLDAPTPYIAFRSVATQLGVELSPLTGKGRGMDVSLHITAVAAADLMSFLGDIGKVNVVLGPGAVPALNIFIPRMPWDQFLSLAVERYGRKLVSAGSMRYVVTKDATVPKLRTKLAPVTLDIDARDATLAQVMTAIRAVAKLEAGSCSDKQVTLQLRRASLAQVVQALEVASGETLGDATPCQSRVLADEPSKDLALRAIAGSGTKRVAVFDHRGAIVVGTVDRKRIEAISTGAVVFVNEAATPVSPFLPQPDAWQANAKRTAAVHGRGSHWNAIVDAGHWAFVKTQVKDTMEIVVTEAGVTIRREGAERTVPLAPP